MRRLSIQILNRAFFTTLLKPIIRRIRFTSKELIEEAKNMPIQDEILKGKIARAHAIFL